MKKQQKRHFAGTVPTFGSEIKSDVDSHKNVQKRPVIDIPVTQSEELTSTEQSIEAEPVKSEQELVKSEIKSEAESESDETSDADSDSSQEFQVSFRRKKQHSALPTTTKKSLQVFEDSIRLQQEQKSTSNNDNSQLLVVDDTDGLDPEKEYADWVVREKSRMQRELDELAAKEQEAFERDHPELVSNPETHPETSATTTSTKGGFFQDIQRSDPLFTKRKLSDPLPNELKRPKHNYS